MTEAEQKEGLIICVIGNIGAGKTTLGKLLAQTLDAEFFPEPLHLVLLNQFLTDPKKYAYAFQLYMLTRRQLNYALALKNKEMGKCTIIDRSLSCDKVFATLQHKYGYITESEIDVYLKIYNDFEKFKPDIVVYLDVSTDTLLERIRVRDREGENKYTRDYLEKLTHEHNSAIEQLERDNIRVCRVDWNDNINFESKDDIENNVNCVMNKILITLLKD